MQLSKEKVVFLVKERGITQNQLARLLNVREGSLSNALSGNRGVGRQILSALLREFPGESVAKGLFMRAFNRLKTERVKLLGDYKTKLEREKFTEIDQERIGKLDEEIESLIQQERALFFIEGNGSINMKS